MYFVPDVSVPGEEDDYADDGSSKKQKRVSVKGALYYEYDLNAHCFVGHLRRVHSNLPPIELELTLDGKKQKVQVKSANPLAPPGYPLYYFHGKTKLYNDLFIQFWDKCMAPVLAIVCPWLTVTNKASLERLLNLRFQR